MMSDYRTQTQSSLDEFFDQLKDTFCGLRSQYIFKRRRKVPLSFVPCYGAIITLISLL